MPSMFYVWDEGCWREMCSSTGDVSGLRGRTEFLYRTDGRLVVAPRETVLAGLRALEAGTPTTVHDGTPILQLRYRRASRVQKRRSAGFCARCCRCRCNWIPKKRVPAARAPLTLAHKKDIALTLKKILTAADQMLSQHVTSKGPVIGTSAGTHTAPAPEFVGANSIASKGPVSTTSVCPIVSTSTSRIADTAESVVRKLNKDTVVKARPMPQLKQSIISSRRSSYSTDSSFKANNVDSKKSKPTFNGHINNTPMKLLNNQKHHFSTEQFAAKLKPSNIKEPIVRIRNDINMVGAMQKLSQYNVDKMSQFLAQIVKQTKKPIPRDMKVSLGSRESSLGKDGGVCKEVNVSESEIMVVRGMLQKYAPQVLLRYDADEGFKRRLFYSLNPVVRVERCQQVLRLLFAERLGLRSTGVAPGDASGALHQQDSAAARPPDTPTEEARSWLRTTELKPQRQIFEVESDSASKEYSELEDQQIVRWVSSESRAHRVKGNQIWHSLQDEYRTLTGRERTWQSLKNRYLRYLLPALGRMALSPRRAAGLRAAAAAGCTRNRPLPPRRNSIFGEPDTRSASGRAPPARRRRSREPPGAASTNAGSGPPSKRPRHHSPPASPTPSSPPTPPRRTPRMRKLFNPNAVL